MHRIFRIRLRKCIRCIYITSGDGIFDRSLLAWKSEYSRLSRHTLYISVMCLTFEIVVTTHRILGKITKSTIKKNKLVTICNCHRGHYILALCITVHGTHREKKLVQSKFARLKKQNEYTIEQIIRNFEWVKSIMLHILSYSHHYLLRVINQFADKICQTKNKICTAINALWENSKHTEYVTLCVMMMVVSGSVNILGR